VSTMAAVSLAHSRAASMTLEPSRE
jgi:hypothetical protein